MSEEKGQRKPACPVTIKGAEIILNAINVCFQLGGIQHAPAGAQNEAEKLSDWVIAMRKIEEDEKKKREDPPNQ